MAKQPASKSGITKVRFMMVEAEGSDADLSQIFAAIQSAVKPTTTIIQQRLPSSHVSQAALTDASGETDDDATEAVDAEDSLPEQPKKARVKTVRKPVTPDVLDFDFEADLSLADFASRHPAVDSDAEKYLLIAAWFKEHRDTAAVTTSHIYTGYRTLNWSTSIEDFGSTLRYLKSQRFMSSGNRGEYLINHLGLGRLKKLASGE